MSLTSNIRDLKRSPWMLLFRARQRELTWDAEYWRNDVSKIENERHSMSFGKNLVLSGLLSFVVLPTFAEVREGQFLNGVQLFADESFSPSTVHACQPKLGDKALIINIVTRVEALNGLNAAKVKITSGKCSGATGWVAIAFLNALV